MSERRRTCCGQLIRPHPGKLEAVTSFVTFTPDGKRVSRRRYSCGKCHANFDRNGRPVEFRIKSGRLVEVSP